MQAFIVRTPVTIVDVLDYNGRWGCRIGYVDDVDPDLGVVVRWTDHAGRLQIQLYKFDQEGIDFVPGAVTEADPAGAALLAANHLYWNI